jgi:hypothetical protein
LFQRVTAEKFFYQEERVEIEIYEFEDSGALKKVV